MGDDVLPAVLPAWSSEIEVAAFDTEYVVLDVRDDRVHHIVGLGAVVFSACDGRTAAEVLVREVTDVLSTEEGVDPELVDRARSGRVRDDIASCFRQLGRLGLFEGIEGDRPAPCLGCGAGETASPRRRRRWWWPFGG